MPPPAQVEGDRRGAGEGLREAGAVSVERSLGADSSRERGVSRRRRDARGSLPVAEVPRRHVSPEALLGAPLERLVRGDPSGRDAAARAREQAARGRGDRARGGTRRAPAPREAGRPRGAEGPEAVPRHRRAGRRQAPPRGGRSRHAWRRTRTACASSSASATRRRTANYTKTYRSAVRRPSRRSCRTIGTWLVAAHQLLRRHGQETCRRSEPRCDVCPARARLRLRARPLTGSNAVRRPVRLAPMASPRNRTGRAPLADPPHGARAGRAQLRAPADAHRRPPVGAPRRRGRPDRADGDGPSRGAQVAQPASSATP